MPVAAQCPSCGNKLSETTVVAGAPHCTACGSWIVGVNGTLGLTSAYGVGDPALTRRRVEADLAVLHEYQMKYTGMMDHCKQKLNWDVGQYAALPQPPQILPLQKVQYSKWKEYWMRLFLCAVFVCMWGIPIDYVWYHIHHLLQTGGNEWGSWVPWNQPEVEFILVILFGCTGILLAAFAFDCFRVQAANGNSPLENERRRKKHKMDLDAALKAAVPRKSAEDHRLRVQIRELEGEIKAVSEKAADVRRILATL